MQFGVASLLFASYALAANVPTFTYTAPAGTTVAAITVDAAGNTYLTGSTTSSTFPTTPGALQTQFSGGNCDIFRGPGGGSLIYPCTDAFVIKLDPAGNVSLATYFGGNGSQTTGNAISVDTGGNIYIGGTTSQNSENNPDTFPVTPGAAFTSPAIAGTFAACAFVAKLNPAASQLVYATFLPLAPPSFVAQGPRPLAMAIDPEGDVYVVSSTVVASLPVAPGAFQATPQNTNGAGAVLKLNASGSALIYATYLSGDQFDIPQGIAVDPAGDAFITGYTESKNFPVTPGAFETEFPSLEYAGFVTKLNPQGTGLVYSTFIGDSSSSGGLWEIKVDSQGGAYVLGVGSVVINGGFLSRLSADGSALIYSTFLPTASGLDLDSTGNAFVAGTVGSGILVTEGSAFQPGFAGGNSDAYAVKITPEGELAGATYLGGSAEDGATLIAALPNGSVVIAGTTQSPNFPGISETGSVGLVLSSSPAAFVTNIFPALTIQNAASLVASTVAPGEIVAIRGYGIGPAKGVSATGPSLPTELAGIQVYFGLDPAGFGGIFDGFQAPLLYVQSQQINAQVPWELAGQTSTTATVFTLAGTPIALAPSLPGIFYVSNSDGTQNSPSNPARPGDFITIYGTGGGPTSPAGVDGAFWPSTGSLPLLTLKVAVTVGSANASVLYAGASPLSPSGIFQINALLPSSLPASAAAPLVVNIGGVSSAAVPVAIQ
jgi:uncharacterized protein (TIGR03437 family)